MMMETDDLVQQLIGRADFCQKRGEVKTPDLLRRAAEVIASYQRNTPVTLVYEKNGVRHYSDGTASQDYSVYWGHFDALAKEG